MMDKLFAGNQDLQLGYWLDNVDDEKIKNYIQIRLITQINYYNNQSRIFKKKYQHLMVLSIFISSLIPIVSVVANGDIHIKLLIALLGSWGTVIGAVLSMNNYKDLWIQYRNSHEFLLSTLYLYFNKGGEFKGINNQKDCDIKLIEICENYLICDVQEWKTIKRE